MKFSVAHVNGAQGRCIEMKLDAPVTVRQAILASPLPHLFPYLDPDTHRTGIYGRLCAPDTPVSEGDRVEIYLPVARGGGDDEDEQD
ncbi:RnfH family protein [Acerihabitans arboris]|uniref:RnfH family protein n=1 Tax=Acerihabitans arboris TaxID=2691583 RepID=A0A845SJ20_9GAMM|nr:RnfH family protein [Acerihabitans arboris]NDL62964.1 RnfH family protein [Acerihabitans arboris]